MYQQFSQKKITHIFFANQKKWFKSHRNVLIIFPLNKYACLLKLNFASLFGLKRKNWRAEKSFMKKPECRHYSVDVAKAEIVNSHIHSNIFEMCNIYHRENNHYTHTPMHTLDRSAVFLWLSLSPSLSQFANLRYLWLAFNDLSFHCTAHKRASTFVTDKNIYEYIEMCVACVGRDLCCFNFKILRNFVLCSFFFVKWFVGVCAIVCVPFFHYLSFSVLFSITIYVIVSLSSSFYGCVVIYSNLNSFRNVLRKKK